jgi:hypothetical protein
MDTNITPTDDSPKRKGFARHLPTIARILMGPLPPRPTQFSIVFPSTVSVLATTVLVDNFNDWIC